MMDVRSAPFGALHDERLTRTQHEVEGLLVRTLPGALMARLVRILGCSGISVRTLRFTIRCSLSLMNGKKMMRRHYGELIQYLERGKLSRVEILEQARFFADNANTLYRLVDNKRRLMQMMKALDSVAIWPAYALYALMAAHHERVATWSEDIAETLALSASEEFTDMVIRDLHAQS